MKTLLLSLVLTLITFASFAQTKKWATNFGLELGSDCYTGTAGLSTLKAAENPLVTTDLKRQYSVEGGFYVEFLQLKQRSDTKWGSTTPALGIKTGLNGVFFRADNSSDGGGQSIGLNYINVPLFLEYCLSYHKGVTRSSYTPGTTTYTGRQNYDRSVTVTESSTPGTYYRGGDKTSGATFIYVGPQISYLVKSFNFSGDPIKDANLNNNYVGLIGGITFCMHQVNLDFSYQKGLTSIYNGKNITVDGFMAKFGINFGQRLY